MRWLRGEIWESEDRTTPMKVKCQSRLNDDGNGRPQPGRTRNLHNKSIRYNRGRKRIGDSKEGKDLTRLAPCSVFVSPRFVGFSVCLSLLSWTPLQTRLYPFYGWS